MNEDGEKKDKVPSEIDGKVEVTNGEKRSGTVGASKVAGCVAGVVMTGGILGISVKLAHDQITKTEQNKEGEKNSQKQKEDEKNTKGNNDNKNNTNPEPNAGKPEEEKEESKDIPWYIAVLVILAPLASVFVVLILIYIFKHVWGLCRETSSFDESDVLA